MNENRLKRVLALMEEEGLSQMIVSDPTAVFYLTGARIEPGERMLVLYISTKTTPKLFLNDLFSLKEDLGMEIVRVNDTMDGPALVAEYTDKKALIGIDKNWPARFLLRLQELGGAAGYVNGSLIIDRVRMIKDEEEKEKMRKASAMNDQVMAEVIPLVYQDLTESEIAKKVLEIYERTGHSRVSFPPIISFGKDAADPHHGPDGTKGKPGECVVIDIGGVYNDYCSDMTRTVFLGEMTPRQKEIYDIVKEANRRGIEAARPGNRMCDVDLAGRRYIEEKGFGRYFTHRIGHSIGLEDHEYGDASSVNEAIIQPGQCFSVEPGIYIPEEGIGVRIEDIVLITENGCEVLNKYPK